VEELRQDEKQRRDGAEPVVEAQAEHPKPATTASTPSRPAGAGRYPLVFAIVGVVLALAAGGLFWLKNSGQPERGTPDEAVRGFLAAIFLQTDRNQVGEFVCASWDPITAITRTVSQVDPQARVSWDNIVVLDSTEERANVLARLGYRYPDDTQPSVHRQWRFRVVNEKGWRVCDARLLVE